MDAEPLMARRTRFDLPPRSEDVAAYQRAYMRQWRRDNRERANAIAKKSRQKNGRRIYQANKDWYDDLKSGPCTDCGQTFSPCAMEWDHRDPATKEFTIGQTRTLAKDRVLAEIAKCDLVCANCHRMREHQRKTGETCKEVA